MTTKMKLLAAVGGLAFTGLSASAATIQIGLQEDGINSGNVTIVAFTTVGGTLVTNSTAFTSTYGDFAVQSVVGASLNTAGLTDLLNTTTSVTNLSGTTKTLRVFISEDGYTFPAGTQLFLESGLGGTKIVGTTTLNGIFQAFADKNNDLLTTATTIASEVPLLDFQNAVQSASANGSTFDTGSMTGVFTRLGTPFSLTSEATLEVSGGGAVQFTDHIVATAAPLPATASMGLGLFGVIGAVGGLSALRRRRAAL